MFSTSVEGWVQATYVLHAFVEHLADESSARIVACPQALLTLRLELALALALESHAVAYSGARVEGLDFVSNVGKQEMLRSLSWDDRLISCSLGLFRGE